MPVGGSTKRVVVGEDDEPIATLLRDAINDEPGYQATVVSDGRKILDGEARAARTFSSSTS